MALFLSTQAAGVSAAENALYIATLADSGFGDTPGSDPTAIQITYTRSNSGFAPERIDALVNTSWVNPIVIFAVDSSFVLPDGTPVTSTAGGTFRPGEDPLGLGRILVFFDASGAGGFGYFVFDAAGQQIGFPTCICLFHELAHAFHLANGTLDSANPEPQAENEENQLRTALGLTLRDPLNHGGGVGGGSVLCPDPTGGPPPDCFIVSAVTGSPMAAEVRRLQTFRDAYLRDTGLGSAFWDALWREYYAFSPILATEIARSPALRRGFSLLAVEPLIEFLGLLELVASDDDPQSASRAARAAIARSADRLATAGISPAEALTLAGWLEAARDESRFPLDRTAGASGSMAFAECVDALGSSIDAAREHLDDARYCRWGLLGPLAMHWRAVAAFRDDGAENAPGMLLRGMTRWLDKIPVPSGYELDGDAVRADLLTLRSVVPNAMLRERLVRQLDMAAPEGGENGG